jgi:hypothetical protein
MVHAGENVEKAVVEINKIQNMTRDITQTALQRRAIERATFFSLPFSAKSDVQKHIVPVMKTTIKQAKNVETRS